MADITELLEQAAEIRDADTENENTALRVGTLLVNIIQTIGDYASYVDLQNAITLLWEQLPTVFAQIDSTGLLRWHQSPIVFLKSMDHDLDDVDGGYYTPTFNVGDVWYSGAAIHYKESAQRTLDYSIRTNCIYVNKHTLRLYEYKSSSFVELTNENRALKNNCVIDDMEVTDLNSMSVGEVAFLPATKKIAIKTAERSWITFSPDPNKIYCDKDAGTTMIWDADEETWQQVGGGGGGGSNVYIDKSGDYVDLIIEDNTPRITVSTASIVMSGNTKTATFKVSGVKLTAPILIRTNNAYFTASPSSISPTGGTVAETTVTVTFGGSTNQEDDIVVSSQGASSKTIHAQYTEEQVPTIMVEETPLSFKAAAGETQQKTLSVSGMNLEAAIAATVEGTNAAKFTVSPASISQSGGSASGTLTITYTPGAGASGTHTATLKLTTTNGQTKSITLNGAVAGTLSISPASDAIGIISGGSGTATFRVQGANLTPNATINVSVNGTGMTLSPSTLSVDSHGEVDDDVTVTFSGTADSDGTLTAECQTDEVSATASVVGSVVTPLPAGATWSDGKLKYRVLSDQTKVSVSMANSSVSGAIEIPSTVSDSGKTATLIDSSEQQGAGCTYTVTEIAESGFNGNNNITSLTLPSTITTIGVNGIRNLANNSMTSFVIPNSVTTIANNNLVNMTKLTSLTIGTGVTTIGDYFLTQSTALASLVIPNNVTSIGSYFSSAGATHTLVDLGTGIKSIAGNSQLKMSDSGKVIIRYTGGTLNYSNVVFVTSSASYPCNATLYVPDTLVDTYKTAKGWGVNNNGGWHMFNEEKIKGLSELTE